MQKISLACKQDIIKSWSLDHFLKLKASTSSHSKSRTMTCTRLLKCFVLQHSVIKTKHSRSLIQGVVLVWLTRNTGLWLNFKTNLTSLTLKAAGGGRIQPIGQEITCHFSQDHTMVTKLLDFIHKHPKYKVVKSFFYYFDRISRNSAKTDQRLWSKITKWNFFNFFITKSPNLISNLNDNRS